jgi:SAM-dependent methyltransferase
MAVGEDFVFLRRVIEAGHLRGPCLEVGSLNHAGGPYGNCRFTVESLGLRYEGADLFDGPDVDHVLDFTDGEAVRATFEGRRFGTVILFSVLEHVYDPIRVLDNALALLDARGGALVISAPVVWELHDYPKDFWRLNPDFYEAYARGNGLELVPEQFVYMYQGQVRQVGDFAIQGKRVLPSRASGALAYGPARHWYSKIVERAFNTLGRRHPFTYAAIGCVLVKPSRPGFEG